MPDLWLQPVDPTSVQWAKSLASMLDEEETRRWHRYRKSEDRALFLVAHVTTRKVLSYAGDRDPGSWRFEPGANGRPEIVQGPTGMRFNISHTKGMVAVLVHNEADCGVDVEHIRRPIDMRSVSRRVFTEAEQAAIFSQPPESQADRFYQLWTLKEAFIKAKGKGFALPLQQFSFSILDNDRCAEQLIEFDCDPTLDAAPEQWQFVTHRPESGHIVSVAAHRETPSKNTSVVIRQFDIEATGTDT